MATVKDWSAMLPLVQTRPGRTLRLAATSAVTSRSTPLVRTWKVVGVALVTT